MPRDLFGDVSDPSVRVGSRKWYTVPLSLFVHTVVLLLVVVIPLVATGALPDPRTIVSYVPVVEAIPMPPPAPRVRAAEPPRANPNAAPLEAPRTIEPEPVRPDGFEQLAEPVEGMVPGGMIDGKGTPEPPPPPPAPVKQQAVPVGGNIRAPERVGYAAPVYPTIAQTAGVQGVVIIEATIDVDGRVVNARILRSRPLLDDAALTAVRQWTYTPTTLNGVAVPVIMTVTVNFQLQR